MKIVNEFPPNYNRILEVFPEVATQKHVVFTVGNVIYNPAGGKLPSYVVAHEGVHTLQQHAIGVDIWWDKYLVNPQFRLEQELEAYQAEYKYFCRMYKDRNERNSFLRFQALMCSSPMYGEMVPFNKAMELIKNDHVL